MNTPRPAPAGGRTGTKKQIQEGNVVIFQTRNGHRYTVNTEQKTIQGNHPLVRHPVPYVTATILVGQNARFYLTDGTIFETSPVEGYLR